MTLWRVFPYDAAAKPGEPFSVSYVPQGQGTGRFDIPDLTPVWYLAESPAHAVAEVIQGFRNQWLDAADLVRFGHPLALTKVTVPMSARDVAQRSLLDLCDPAILLEHAIRPDTLASADFTKTQRIARMLFSANHTGFRWWSALTGDWHTTVVFHTNLRRRELKFDTPRVLTVASEAVVEAARRMAIQIR